ncbi:MAG: 1,2-phenylacetyl-CoA epoxidase subunit PaaC [Woeseiaceae bacterium]|nr:1,2-phenylacetyl-CoA epoxidase subunit PaaC [Woeseiaceae bacterium]
MNTRDALLTYVLRLGDNALITAQRMIERVTGEPELEEELANANFALDYVGQARLFYGYAGELENRGRSEDDFAFLRDAQAFRNFLMVEQPNGHFGDAIVRQVLFESFYVLQLEALATCSDKRLADIAARAVKEIRYHLRHATQWLIRLGDGTADSHRRVAGSLDVLGPLAGEFFDGDDVDELIRDELAGPDLAAIRSRWEQDVSAVLSEARLSMPEIVAPRQGGRSGVHSEHLGYLVAEMQHLPRSYPGAAW